MNSNDQPDTIDHEYMHKQSKLCDEDSVDDHTQEYLQNDREKVSINILNDDCLRYIFEYMTILDRIRAERVCRHWKDMSQEFWRTIRISHLCYKWKSLNGGKLHTSILCKLLQKYGRFLKQLDITVSYYYFLNDTREHVINMIARLCPNLININIKGISVTPSDINIFTKNYKNITRFVIGTTCNLDNELSDFFSIQKNLEYFEIDSADVRIRLQSTGKCLTFLPAETMHTLIIDWQNIHDNSFSMALERLGNLEKLVIKSSGLGKCTLKSISKYCKNLKVLHLYCFFCNIEINSFNFNFVNLVQLKSIKITYSNWISNDDIANMTLNCRELIDVDIAGCKNVTAVVVESIATLPKLERLNISSIENITDQCLRHLRDLKVLKCANNCSITNEGLSVVLRSSSKLMLLDISFCSNIDKHILKVATEVCNRRTNNVPLKIVIGGLSAFSRFPVTFSL